MKKVLVVLGVIAVSVVASGDDLAWLSLEPGGEPVEYLEVSPGDTFTLWSVLHNGSGQAAVISFPIEYEPPLEYIDHGFSEMSFDFLGLCVSVLHAWNFVLYYDSINSYVTWFPWTGTYPTCSVPQGSQQDIGWVEFRMANVGVAEITEGLSPTGLDLFYDDGVTL